MFVVAVIAVLAVIVIPSFFAEANRAKGNAEVAAMFSAIRIAEDGYKSEHAVYLSTGADETDGFPAAPTSAPQQIQGVLPTAWATLRFQPPQPTVHCSYVAIAGAAGESPGPLAVGTFAMDPAPATSWFYILATCNLDGDPAVNGLYFTSSLDSTTQDLDPGH